MGRRSQMARRQRHREQWKWHDRPSKLRGSFEHASQHTEQSNDAIPGAALLTRMREHRQ